jgi:hypothetical protein
MQRQGFSPRNIQYFERDFLDQLRGVINSTSLNLKRLGNLRLFHIKGLPKFWGEGREDSVSIGLVTEDLVSGLFESGVPIFFSAFGKDGGLEIIYGTFAEEGLALNVNAEILKTCLESSFHGLDLSPIEVGELLSRLSDLSHMGIMTGAPSERIIQERFDFANIERLMRGISGRSCGFVVIGTPMGNEGVNSLFNMVLNEIRIILESERHVGQENPTVRQYKTLLEKYLEKLQRSKSQGLWVSNFFMYADRPETLDQLKALTKSAFSGRESVPDRIRTLQLSGGRVEPGLILNPAPASPGQFKWPYMYSNILGSSDLAKLLQLPGQEFPGYKVIPYVRFNVSKEEGDGINIGEVLDQGKRLGSNYKVPLKGLKKHGLIVGGTGSGKTNTLFYMLRDLIWKDIPFLVLEPAKTEYRKLLYSDIFSDKLQVFTLGDNNVSPFRLNPFKFHEGISVQTHLDLLKSVFNASFYMWGPLPHVLERCLYEIYQDKGWDLTSNRNSRGVHVNAYPTLTDLYNKVDDVVDELGYSPETTMELKSSLKTRLNSLRIGGKGLMLDTKSSVSFENLLKRPTVLELETLGDDEEKAFMMGLVLTMMYEYYVSQGFSEDKNLGHITVIEEAHRLLGDTDKNNAFTGDMKGKAVETFTNILSEIRAYGEGFLIAEQIPTKLSSDVVKNTNLKVMHRIVSEDDRRVMASSMNIKNEEADIVATLSVGEAVVYSDGDDGAYNIQVPYAKLDDVAELDEDSLIQEKMRTYLRDSRYISPYLSCPAFCSNVCSYKDIGEEVRENYRLRNAYHPLVLSLVEGVGYEDSITQMFETGNDQARISGNPLGVKTCAAVQGAENFFEYLGSKYHWTYEDQVEVLSNFLDLYVDALSRYIGERRFALDEGKLESFSKTFLSMVQGKQPESFCRNICEDGTCRYRYSLEKSLEDEFYHNTFVETINEGGADMWERLYQHCLNVANTLGPSLDTESLERISLCYALQKCYTLESFEKRHVEQVMTNLYNLENTPESSFP